MVSLRGIELEVHGFVEDVSSAIRRDQDFYEKEILDYLAFNYKKHGIIIDVGANIGNHTVYFANFLKYDGILAFEPVPENYSLLKKNVGAYKNVVAVEAAASDFNGRIAIARNFNNMGASKVLNRDEEFEGILIADCAKIDSYYMFNVTLLKIDAEEHEPWVLKGAAETIERWHPLILIEDANNEYRSYLPASYELVKYWNKYRTYLYEFSRT